MAEVFSAAACTRSAAISLRKTSRQFISPRVRISSVPSRTLFSEKFSRSRKRFFDHSARARRLPHHVPTSSAASEYKIFAQCSRSRFNPSVTISFQPMRSECCPTLAKTQGSAVATARDARRDLMEVRRALKLGAGGGCRASATGYHGTRVAITHSDGPVAAGGVV
ncbi:MAG: hypothetical protein AVDCRST_MAG91-568 [uncultured Sphingomonadaceae bacterium]|uniref:Uncharacterized protein n=1 Tax=uncultured Sphingomonadaceae bacterium TaxID=169976 RepID=A0A6J4SC36_9SPHN|nr:MAG: hypothetical protein AVDCRST_MAG91-568 [uncultured Sphingomonadaceae bacterium]